MRFATSRSESSRTSHRRTLIGRQWTDLHYWCGVLNANQDLTLAPRAEWNPAMMLRLRDHSVLAPSLAMHRDPLIAVVHFDLAQLIADPYLFPGINPRHRIAAALPGDVSISSHLPQFIIGERIGRSSIQRQ